MSSLNKNQHRIIAVSLLGLVVLLVLLVVFVPLVNTMNSYNESIDDLSFELRRYKREIAGKDKILDQLQVIKRRQWQENHFSNRETSALASADLQQLIKKVVVDSGGRLTSTQVIPEQQEEHFIRTAIKVRMSGDSVVLRDVLYSLETATPMLMIENLMVRSVRGRRDRKTRKLMQSNELNVNFEVSGYMRAASG